MSLHELEGLQVWPKTGAYSKVRSLDVLVKSRVQETPLSCSQPPPYLVLYLLESTLL